MKTVIRTRALTAVMAAAVLAAAPLSSASSLPKPPPAPMEAINTTELRKHVEFLASPELGGRYSVSPGIQIAARYLASRLESYGFRGAGPGGSFFQPFELLKMRVKPSASRMTLTIDGRSEELEYGDFVTFATTGGSGDAPIVFAGYGVSAPSLGHDDYAGLDVKGKIVLVAPGVPQGIDSSKLDEAQHGAGAAASRGAVAVVSLPPAQYLGFMRSPQFKEFVLARENIQLGHGASSGIPTLILPPAPAEKIVAPLGMTLDEVYAAADEQRAMAPRALNASARFNLALESETSRSQNVVAVLEGSDPKLRDEYVSLSSHYDHLKTNAKGQIFPGADDDASGTAAVLNIAKAFAMERPKRSVLVIFHSAEELGLLGSQYNADVKPAVPLAQIVVNLNVDMIGRSRAAGDTNPRNAELTDAGSIYIIGSDKLSTELHEISEKTNADTAKMRFDYTYNDPNHPQQFYYRSDHWNYAKHGVPVIFYFSGVHEDYHQPTDTIEKLDFEKITKVTRLIYATGWRVANLEHRLKVDVAAAKSATN